MSKRGTILRTLEDRFGDKVDRTDICWLWRGNMNASGYGRHPGSA